LLVCAREDLDQRRLAGAVLPEQGMNLARLNGEINVVVRDQVTEALGDAAQFESQRNLPRPGADTLAAWNTRPAPTAMISPRGPARCH